MCLSMKIIKQKHHVEIAQFIHARVSIVVAEVNFHVLCCISKKKIRLTLQRPSVEDICPSHWGISRDREC